MSFKKSKSPSRNPKSRIGLGKKLYAVKVVGVNEDIYIYRYIDIDAAISQAVKKKLLYRANEMSVPNLKLCVLFLFKI